MRYLRFVFLVFVLGTFSLNSSLFADEEVQEPQLRESFIEAPACIQADSSSKNSSSPETQKYYPRFVPSKSFQPSKSMFFQSNIGVGFLYFSGIRGNLIAQPAAQVDSTYFVNAPVKGPLSYNRTPLFEYLLGYQFNSWLKLALSYQYQGGVVVQSEFITAFLSTANSGWIQFSSNLSLNALLAKVYFELPYAMVLKNFSINPYLALGVGPGWQSWTQTNINYVGFDSNLTVGPLPLQQRLNASAVWMCDLGFRMQKASPNNQFSLVMGCKYNQWGQARNIGKLSHQRSLKLALPQPVQIKTVYQFAPYLGVQWSFLPSQCPNYTVNGRSPKVWLPYWVNSKQFHISNSIWTQFNAGIGFLYFSGLRGNLMGKPTVDFTTEFRDVPVKGRLTYNRAPLFEYLLGYRFNPWLKLAFSYQHQAGVNLQTKGLQAYGDDPNDSVSFSSNLSLDALLAKVYFELPFSMIWRSLAVNPYLAIGVGPGWQSWTQAQALYISNADATTNFITALTIIRQKLNANAVWMLDWGLRVQSALPSNIFSVVLGCKYNQWGQARNLGKLSHQNGLKVGLTQPLRIKTIYQFAPYLGVQWNFSPNKTSGYQLKGKCPHVWTPYWASSTDFQCPTSIWTQFNTGIGFLYFSGIKGNLMGAPAANFLDNSGLGIGAFRDIPLKGRLSYNRTPLFEYLVGYKFNAWLKLALAYQYQGGVVVQTKALQAYDPNTPSYGQFSSNLNLNGILAKVYFELPFSMIWQSLAMNPYIALGVGPGWQSWTNVSVSYTLPLFSPITSLPLPLRQKISANAIWMVDLGLRIQSAYPNSKFSVLMGCKYNQWGQARSIGKLSQHGNLTSGIFHPFTIKTIYQFAPYLGVQWNF